MKRRLASFLILALILISPSAATSTTGVPIRVYIHGQSVPFPDQLPVIIDGRTLVPIRGVFEAPAVFIGSRTAWVNGQQRILDVAPRIIGNRTMVPLRFLAEAMGESIRWDSRYPARFVSRCGRWTLTTPILVVPSTKSEK